MKYLNVIFSYETLEEPARTVAELVELATRLEVEKERARVVPGHKAPDELINAIRERYSWLSEDAKAAVVDLRNRAPRPNWERWLKQHLACHPKDAACLSILERDFAGAGVKSIGVHTWEHYGFHNHNWKLDYQGADFTHEPKPPAPCARPSSIEDKIRELAKQPKAPPVPPAPPRAD